MRISDWSSDVCSSDLPLRERADKKRPRRSGVSVTRRLAPLRSAAQEPVPKAPRRRLRRRTIAELIVHGNPSRKGQAPAALSCRSEEHTSELQSLMRISYAVFCLKKKIEKQQYT